MLKEHPAYQEEKVRLKETIDEVEKAVENYNYLYDFYKEDVETKLREFKHNPNEGSQLYIDLMTGVQFVKNSEDKLKGLTRSRNTPYFARVDFIPNDTGILEKCYIGKTGLLREDDNYPLIIDWRAPAATLYYEGRLGDASYSFYDKIHYEETTIPGELALKRQFTIENGALKEIFDIDVTTNDPLLQKALGANAENRLKDIASTIQAEQNKIIRANMKNPLIVQGVAGSGKTTIALHRIAYLIYNYENVFTPDSFMIIAPNRLFLDYISAVLPELGVDQVRQTTFMDFMLEQLGEDFKYRVSNPNEKLTSFVNLKNDTKMSAQFELLKQVSRFKGSLDFKKTIDRFINDLEEDFIPREDLKLDNHVLFPASQIRHIFLNEYKYYPIYSRVPKLKTRMKKAMKGLIADMIEKEKTRVDTLVDQFYSVAPDSEAEREKILKRIEERDYNITHWQARSKTLIDEYFKNTPAIKLMEYYEQLLCDPDTLELYTGGLLTDEFILFIGEHTKKRLDGKQVEYEDLAPLVYMQQRLYGLPERLRLGHVVIDEAQDFSLFQYYMIRRLTRTDSFSIFGDMSQGIHSYRAVLNWDEVQRLIFQKTDSTYHTLEQSYRTTIEIMNLANEVIKQFPYEGIILAKPIIRHGELPYFMPHRSPEEIVQWITGEVEQLKETGVAHTVAIIGKTMEECKLIHDLFPAKAKPVLVTEDMSEYKGGTIILPSYLAKGLEFDAVFIVNLKETYEHEEMDIKLLYIAMTRALHRLYLCSTSSLSPLLHGVNAELFQSVGGELAEAK